MLTCEVDEVLDVVDIFALPLSYVVCSVFRRYLTKWRGGRVP